MHRQLRRGEPVMSAPVELVHARVEGQQVTFCVNMRRDPVQRTHRTGTFYELKALQALRQIFPKGGVFADIGANVGNHSLYAALFMNAGKVIPFEPNPRAYELLIQNVLVNRLSSIVDLSKLGVGVSDTEARGFAMEDRSNNLGAARMLPGRGDLQVFSGDSLLATQTPDLIKIDVEGMELKVLNGLRETIARAQPTLMVEVDADHDETFFEWIDAQDYALLFTHQRYKASKNHVIAPKTRIPDLRRLRGEAPD